jgi:hypothetical protein
MIGGREGAAEGKAPRILCSSAVGSTPPVQASRASRRASSLRPLACSAKA